ncbi:MAG: glucose-6-phosphate isomerase family protein [Lachnospiraceae bacterium]|nr:glucose-6-phosphate isomerase family protein [Lachnospiraceae bacterium]MDD2957808.1 glucose-6-phosphate isomerase family protein [Lachnospiraceae bacterium]
MNNFNWDGTFSVDFSFQDGMSKTAEITQRHLSQMKAMYQDQAAVEEILKTGDPVIYEFYELGCPEREGDLAFGTTMIHPGKIGNEYYMTKGHFHNIVNTSEVYYTMQGKGFMLMENMEGDWMAEPLEKGKAVYVPRGYAHRTINTGDETLIAFFTFAADAGHDYGTIETKGYRNVILEKDGKPVIEPNPKWK